MLIGAPGANSGPICFENKWMHDSNVIVFHILVYIVIGNDSFLFSFLLSHPCRENDGGTTATQIFILLTPAPGYTS